MKREIPSVDDMARYGDTHFFHQKISEVNDGKSFKLKVLSGRSNRGLALDIVKILGMELGTLTIKEAASQELGIKADDVLGDDVYLVQTLCESEEDGGVDLNSACMELLFAIQNLRLAGAGRITAIVPYFAYSRQDRKIKPRVPIAASALAQLITSMGVDRVVTVDLHRGQVQGFFRNVPVDNIPTHREFEQYIKEHIMKDEGMSDPAQELTIVAPDSNGVERARIVANGVLARSVATCLTRQVDGKPRIDLVGDVKGQVCVIIDDLIDSGMSIANAAKAVKEKGAKSVYALVTHGLLTDAERIKNCDSLKRLVVTDSVNLLDKAEYLGDKLHVVTIAPMLAMAIMRCHTEVSLAAVFD